MNCGVCLQRMSSKVYVRERRIALCLDMTHQSYRYIKVQQTTIEYCFMQEGVFRKVGMLIGMSLVQGGSGYPFFAPCIFSYLCGTDLCSNVVGRNEISDWNLSVYIMQTEEMNVIVSFQKTFIFQMVEQVVIQRYSLEIGHAIVAQCVSCVHCDQL